MCGYEGKVTGKGSHTLAFVRWHFPFFFFVFMQPKFHCHTVVVFFSRLVGNGFGIGAAEPDVLLA
ncbi:MAG TPA: hypothetical protein PLP65_02770, partial [Bacteroidales bacterium]|nr:hypothetical protein [Bacteroidales bacterium]